MIALLLRLYRIYRILIGYISLVCGTGTCKAVFPNLFLPMPHFFHTKNLAPHQHTNKHNQNENFKINGNLLIISETFF